MKRLTISELIALRKENQGILKSNKYPMRLTWLEKAYSKEARYGSAKVYNKPIK